MQASSTAKHLTRTKLWIK